MHCIGCVFKIYLSSHRLQSSLAPDRFRQPVGHAGAGEPARPGGIPGGGLGGPAQPRAHLGRPTRAGPGQRTGFPGAVMKRGRKAGTQQNILERGRHFL